MTARDTPAGRPPVTGPAYLVIDADGRLAIPLPLLAAAGLRPGDRVGVEADGVSLLVRDPRDILGEHLAAVGPPGPSAVDELIADRRDEAAREEAGHQAWLARAGGRPADSPAVADHDD